MESLTLHDADTLQAKVITWYRHSFTSGRRRLVNDQVLKALAMVATTNENHHDDVTNSNHQRHYSSFWGSIQPSWELLRLLLSLNP